MTRIKSLVLAAIGVALLGLSSLATAAPITIPPGLNPGDQYRLAFVTSTTRDATSSNIAVYNDFVTASATAQAELNALGTTWTAIASTEDFDARDNTSTRPSNVSGGSLGVRIFLLDGSKLVDSYDDLWDGSIDRELFISETGAEIGQANVWTGTGTDGIADASGALGAPDAVFGSSGFADGFWTSASTADTAINLLRLYGLSATLTVAALPVSEPGPLGIMALGLIGLTIMRRKRAALSAS
jgi:hypothetical protein